MNRASRARVARHEAAHYEVAAALGGYGLEAEVYAEQDGDGFAGHFTGLVGDQVSRADEAAILLAGLAAAPDTGSPNDVVLARKTLRGTGVSMRQARGRARELVRENRGAIRRRARKLAG